MKIKEIIERECCHAVHDLKHYRGVEKGGTIAKGDKLKFCAHCGQIWTWDRTPGDMDYGWEKVYLDESVRH